MKRPRLKRTLERIDTAEGDVLLLRSSGDAITITAPDRDERALLGALDGSHSLAELERRFADAAGAIGQMRALGMIEDAAEFEQLPASELERFDRQLRYFSDVAEDGLSPADCQTQLRDAKVAVLGVGGLGGRTALELACIGIGELRLADGDRVETSNLNRQIQFSEADVGALKVEATARRLRAFNSQTRVEACARQLESQADVAEFIAGADVVVDAADWPPQEIERICNAACVEAGIPYISMSHEPPIARIGPFYVPGVTGCHCCEQIAIKRDYPLYETVIEQLRESGRSAAPTLGPACGLTGGLVAIEVMHFLTGLVEPASLGRAHVYDLRTMEVQRQEITRESSCPVCAHL
ncbi:MAG: TOMM precursor leader peptide-binding protein [Solirubrobacterales bacterium]